MNFIVKGSYRKWPYIVSGLVFTFGIIISVLQRPQIIRDLNLFPTLIVFFIGVPISILLNAFEYILMGEQFQKKIPFLNAIEICILASATNMLPLPGGAITRIAGLKNAGITYAHATIINILFGVIWLAIACLASGAGLFVFDQKLYGWAFLLAGTTLLILGMLKMFIQGASLPIVTLSILQRSSLVIVDLLRLWGCLIALRIDANISQTTIFALGGVLGSAVSIVPAGLGIREGISAGLAPLVGLGAAAGFLAAALNRLLGLSFLVPTALLLLKLQRNKINAENP